MSKEASFVCIRKFSPRHNMGRTPLTFSSKLSIESFFVVKVKKVFFGGLQVNS